MKDGIYILLGKGFFQPMSNQESLEGPSAGVMMTAGCQVIRGRLAERLEGQGFT